MRWVCTECRTHLVRTLGVLLLATGALWLVWAAQPRYPVAKLDHMLADLKQQSAPRTVVKAQLEEFLRIDLEREFGRPLKKPEPGITLWLTDYDWLQPIDLWIEVRFDDADRLIDYRIRRHELSL